MNPKVKNLIIRTLSGAVLLVVVLGSALFSSYSLAALLLLIVLGSMVEFYRVVRKTGLQPQTGYGIFVGGALFCGAMLATMNIVPLSWLGLIAPLLMVVFIVELYRNSANPAGNIGVTLAGILYVALPLSLLGVLGVVGSQHRPWVVLSIIFTVWANDVGAYLSGMALGRHKLFERISPKKTWEGFVGGLICAIGMAALAGHLQGCNIIFWGGLGLVISVTGVLGDLVESMFKRSAGIKDSGNILPGHGGFLDRFDALILCSPFVFAYFIIFNH